MELCLMLIKYVAAFALLCSTPTWAQTSPSAAPQSSINWNVSEDHRSVTLSVDATPTATYDAAQVEGILAGLGQVRASMLPVYPPNYELGQPIIQAARDPGLATELATDGHTMLHIRDPRYGWLHFAISREAAGKLAAALRKQVDNPPGPSQQTR
jgi:hypothetical protein